MYIIKVLSPSIVLHIMLCIAASHELKSFIRFNNYVFTYLRTIYSITFSSLGVCITCGMSAQAFLGLIHLFIIVQSCSQSSFTHLSGQDSTLFPNLNEAIKMDFCSLRVKLFPRVGVNTHAKATEVMFYFPFPFFKLRHINCLKGNKLFSHLTL